MTPAVLDLRGLCVRVVAADEFSRRGDCAPPPRDFVRMARVLFSLTASTDPAVQEAIAAAVQVAMEAP